jgi:hypothetical protein
VALRGDQRSPHCLCRRRYLGLASLPVQPPPNPVYQMASAVVRELQRRPHPWLDTRVWIHNTTRSPAPLPSPTRTNPDWISNHRLPAQRASFTSHATSPTTCITSRTSDDECAPSHAASASPQPDALHPLQRARPRTVCMLRVTDAPTPLCVEPRRSRCSAEGGVQVKVEEGVSSQPAAERVPHSSLIAVGGYWVCTVSQGVQLTAAGWTRTGGSVHRCCSAVRDTASQWRGN